ncbi:hypothetical protein, partial [Nitrosomonas halophila]|uniref:hypothetical protein n=1 Tax=Nitrosomonas halophila TaxID=44576 RepID=UPI001C409134
LLRDWAGCSTITGHGLTKGAFGYPQILPRSQFFFILDLSPMSALHRSVEIIAIDIIKGLFADSGQKWRILSVFKGKSSELGLGCE